MPMADDRTHGPDCWRKPDHHDCAVKKTELLVEALARKDETARAWAEKAGDEYNRAEATEAALATARAEIERLTARVARDDALIGPGIAAVRELALEEAAREPLCVRCGSIIAALKTREPQL